MAPPEVGVLSRVSICMVERPGDSSKLTSRYPSGFFKPPLPKAQGPSKKKALAAAQKSRAFAMRARVQLSKRHSYAANSEYFIDDETDSKPTVPSSNLVSHFVSTRNISTYYDGTDQRIVTPQEILTSKREEFFNAFKNTYRPQDQFGGSVQHLPVSAKEFAIQDVIPEVNEVESPVKPVNPFVAETRIVPDTAPEHQTSPVTSPASVKTGFDDKENEITVHRQNSEASSSGSSTHHSSQTSTAFDGSTWSLSTDMTSNQSVRMRKPSLRRRLQGAFSFQNIRRAISMEKLSEEEKRRSMSHHYINEAGTHDLGAKSSTLGSDRSQKRDEPVRKSSSIMNMFPSVRMRKRRSRMHKDARNRYTISGPEDLPDEAELKNKRSPMRPMSLIVPSSYNRKKPDRVGNPSFFRPIGRVLQMNPIEGTLLVEMVKPPSGPFGFYIARKKGAGDSGNVFISRLSDSYPDKMFAGLMRTGDEITEVNGTDVAGLSLDQVYDLILDSERTLLKIKPSQVHVV